MTQTRTPPDQPSRPEIADLVDLVDAARAGQPAAFAALVQRFSALVRASALRVSRDPDDVADVMQQTWLIMMQRIDTLRVAEALPGWLATIARREAVRVAQSRHRTISADERLQDVADVAESPEDHAIRLDMADRVHQALARMPQDRARLLIHVVAVPRPYRDVASELSYPIGSLGPLRARYLTQLTAELKACGASAA